MNRVITLTYPEDVLADRKILTPTYNKAGALEKMELTDSSSTTTYVEHIAYNAKGQRLLVAYGNGIMSRYAYDRKTFRLLRQRSESFTQSTWTFTGAGNVKQDTAYDYDLTGNIIASHYATANCGVSAAATLDRDFDYDPLYRFAQRYRP